MSVSPLLDDLVVGAQDLLQTGSDARNAGEGPGSGAVDEEWPDPLSGGLVNSDDEEHGGFDSAVAQRAAALGSYGEHVRTHIAAMVERITVHCGIT